jgi:hypothetical protein
MFPNDGMLSTDLRGIESTKMLLTETHKPLTAFMLLCWGYGILDLEGSCTLSLRIAKDVELGEWKVF